MTGQQGNTALFIPLRGCLEGKKLDVKCHLLCNWWAELPVKQGKMLLDIKHHNRGSLSKNAPLHHAHGPCSPKAKASSCMSSFHSRQVMELEWALILPF